MYRLNQVHQAHNTKTVAHFMWFLNNIPEAREYLGDLVIKLYKHGEYIGYGLNRHAYSQLHAIFGTQTKGKLATQSNGSINIT